MARNVYVTTELTGAGSALDGIDSAALVKGDMAFYINKDSTALAKTMGNFYGVYTVTTSAKSTDVPEVIWPDVNPIANVWEKLQPLIPIFHTTGKAATIPNYGIQVIRTTAPTVHVMRRPRKGAYKKLVFASTQIVKIRLTTQLAANTVKVAMAQKLSVASSCVCIISSSRNCGWGGVLKFPNVMELCGRSTAIWEILTQPTTKKCFTFSTTT